MIILKDIPGEDSCAKCDFRKEKLCIELAKSFGLPDCIYNHCYFQVDENSPENLNSDKRIFDRV